MPIIKPVSELRNYPEILKDVRAGCPIFLTKNGTGRYVILDIADYANVEAAERLSAELVRGRLSGDTEGWTAKEAMRTKIAGK
jgi:prevent-host-death family protein